MSITGTSGRFASTHAIRIAGAVRQVGQDGDGDGQSDAVLFDFNHPLAGQPVTFEVQVIGVL